MKILVSTDGSELSVKAIQTAVELAASLKGSVVGMTAVSAYEYAAFADYGEFGEAEARDESRFDTEQGAAANDRLSVVEKAARAAGVSYDLVMTRAMPPWKAILDAAEANNCQMIVMASHGRSGLGALLLGSETQKVLAHGDRPVLVVR